MNQKLYISALLARVGDLPAMPGVAQKALGLIRDPDTNMSSLANILALDQSLAGLVLRWANSAYYGLRNPATTVQQAVTHLGMQAVRNVILAYSVANLLDRPAYGYGLERGELWRHSIGMAAGARLVAVKFGYAVAEEAYTAGLLADIGKLALEVLLRNVDTSTEDWQGIPFSDLETAHFGVDHAVLGAELAHRWNLPPALQDAIAFHHVPASATTGAVLAASVHIADAAMMMLGIGIGRDGLQYNLDPAACKMVGWNEQELGVLVDKVVPFIEEADEMIRTKKF